MPHVCEFGKHSQNLLGSRGNGVVLIMQQKRIAKEDVSHKLYANLENILKTR